MTVLWAGRFTDPRDALSVTNKAWCSDLGQGRHSLSCACPTSGHSSGLEFVSAGITCGAGAAL